MIDKHMGKEAVLADAQDVALTDSYGQALDAEELRPIAQPDIGESSRSVPVRNSSTRPRSRSGPS